MVFTQIIPLLVIVIFWMIMFVFIFWFFNHSRSVARDEEPGASADEMRAAEQESAKAEATAERESAKVEMDDQIPSTPGH